MTTPSGSAHQDDDGTKPSYNVFRDSLLRYMGYANEVGESFRYQYPRFVVPTYLVAFGYVVADAASTSYSTWQDTRATNTSERWKKTIYAGSDTLLWQSLASVMIPGAIINVIVKASRHAVRRSPFALAPMVAKWLPTATGLGSVPLIVQPIDHSVDFVLDNSTRHWWKQSYNTAV